MTNRIRSERQTTLYKTFSFDSVIPRLILKSAESPVQGDSVTEYWMERNIEHNSSVLFIYLIPIY